MSKKPNIAEQPVAQKLTKARREGRTQQALELVRELVKQQPTDAHRELLRQVTLERGLQLQSQGKPRDAVTVYQNALAMGGSAEFIATVAMRLAACGAVAPALAAMERVPDPAHRQRILNNVVDAAVAQGPAGRNGLPADLHAGFDLIQQAFTHYEAGRDEEARESLQGVGLQSPFLEWKLFLRGLISYVNHDDERARENWQRLSNHRFTFTLAAMMRAGIDPAFLASQPPAAQQMLRTKSLQQQGVAVAPLLRQIKDLLHEANLAPAFRVAEQAVPLLRRDHPDLVPRMANCFAWAIIDHGEPGDLERFERVFDCPADDPYLCRLEALAVEHRGNWSDAHKCWQDCLESIVAFPKAWPQGAAPRVQALIWAHMAENAAFNRQARRPSGNPFFDLLASRPATLKPSAEQCLENALKLAPDRLATYRDLFDVYRSNRKLAKAKKIGQKLLERFPDHAETMAALGGLCMDTGDFKKAQDYFEKAIHANPLDRTLRAELAAATQYHAIALTHAGKLDKAREQFEKAVELWPGPKTSLLCEWAVAELKANDAARAEELIAQANAEPDHRLACRYALVGASVRAKLPPKLKKQIAADLQTAFAQAPTPGEILVLIESAAHQRMEHDDAFHGQKSQEKTILKFLDTIKFSDFNEAQLRRLCVGLAKMSARKPWFACLNYARRHFLKSPFFRMSYADYYLMEPTRDPKTHLAREHLDDARRLIHEMPRGELQQQMLDDLKVRDEMVAEIQGRQPRLGDVMEQFLSGGGPFQAPDDDDDFDDEEDW